MKTTKEFIERVIAPIETYVSDPKPLYILLPSESTLLLIHHPNLYKFGVLYDAGWDLPTKNQYGAWRHASIKDNLVLYSLLGLLAPMNNLSLNGSTNVLFEVESEGITFPIKDKKSFLDMVSSDNKMLEVETKIKIYNTLYLGVFSSKARLKKQINNWNPLEIWKFTLSCIDRTLPYLKQIYPDIDLSQHERCIRLSHAELNIYSEKQVEETKGVLNEFDQEKRRTIESFNANLGFLTASNFSYLSNEKLHQLKRMSVVEKFGRLIIDCLNFNFHKSLAGLNSLRANSFYAEYQSQYVLPNLLDSSVEEKEAYWRIFYNLIKAELIWQAEAFERFLLEKSHP